MTDFGTYSLSTAGFYLFRKLDILNNNLANVNTVGYKRDKVSVAEQRFNESLASEMGWAGEYSYFDFDRYKGSRFGSEITDFSQGPIIPTQRPLDVALTNPNQFFVVQINNGLALTRAGNLEIDKDGDLATPSGYKILSEGGFINVQGASNVRISTDGSVYGLTTEGITFLGKIRVVQTSEPPKKLGGNLFEAQGNLEPVTNPNLAVESIEQSNVELIPTIVNLITTNKQFDLYVKLIKTIDEINQSSINGGSI